MPAHIRIDGGLFSGRTCWIEKQVVGIGSGANCEVLVPDPDFPDSAITLEYRKGKYYLFGQQGVSIDAGGKRIPELTEFAWAGDLTLRVNGSVHLTLVVDPANPEPRPVTEWSRQASAEDTIEPGIDLKGPVAVGGSASVKPKKFPILETTVIGICGLGMAFMLLAGGGSKRGEPATSEVIDFEKDVVPIAQELSEHTKDSIQRAEIAFKHQAFEEAKAKYLEALREVRTYSPTQGNSKSGHGVSSGDLEKLKEFLKLRISESSDEFD